MSLSRNTRRSIGQTLASALAFVAVANMGCATSIAAKYPHLDRRPVCLVVPGIEPDATEFIFTENNVPVSNFHPEVIARVAPTARTVFEFQPDADPKSVQYLPAPHNQLTCPKRFSPLPSRDAETRPLPEASLELLVHEPRPEIVPRAVAEKLASCPSPSSDQLKPIEYTVRFNVYVTNDGQAVSAVVAQSTLGDRKTEACMVNALRTTLWPVDATAVKATSVQAGASTVSPASKLFFAQPAPQLPDLPDRPSGIYPKQPPQGEPKGVRLPRIFVIPLSPIAAAGAVFGIVYFWSNEDAPAWVDELNPITRGPYTSLEEYEDVRRLSRAQILAAQRAQAAAAKPTVTPAAPPVAGTRRNPGQTCDDSVLDELEKQKRDICTSERWTCSNDFENIGKKKEKLLTCAELLPRVARGQACLKARERIQTECYAGSPEPNHDGQIENVRKGVKECVDKAAVRGPGGGPC